MQSEIDRVLDRLNALLSHDGGSLALVEVRGDAITVEFRKGQLAGCESCALDDGAMEMLVREAIGNHLPAVRNVRLVTN